MGANQAILLKYYPQRIIHFPSWAIVWIIRHGVLITITHQIEHQCLKNIIARSQEDDAFCAWRIRELVRQAAQTSNAERL